MSAWTSSKAFYTVFHDILIGKLDEVIAKRLMVGWIANWLNGWSQGVVVIGTESSLRSVTTGVTQGSIMGPVFFNLLISDLDRVPPQQVY